MMTLRVINDQTFSFMFDTYTERWAWFITNSSH